MKHREKTMTWQHLEELRLRVMAGDEEARDEFFTAIFALLLAWLRKRGFRDGPDEDLAGEILLRVMKSLDQYEPREGSGFNSWIFQITRHVIWDWKQQEQGATDLDDPNAAPFLLEKSLSELEWDSEDDPATPRRLAVREAVARLGEKEQKILHLRYFEDGRSDDERTFKSIGLRLGLNEGTARQQHNRAVMKLAVMLADDPRVFKKSTT